MKQIIINQEKLSPSKNAWRGRQRDHESENDSVKKANAILNKLTLEKFDRLSDKFIDILVNNEEKIEEIVKGLFNKAIDEEFFAIIYARLCRKVADIKKEDNTPLIAGFKKIILTQCQKEFENASSNCAIDLSNDTESEYKLMKIKRHMLGNIKFIGELFKQDLVTDRILRRCIKHLMPNIRADEESMENLCKLLETSGKKLDNDINKKNISREVNELKKCFILMNNISQRDGLSLRIKFLITDILELRERNWKPRSIKANQGPRTISDNHN